MFWFSLSWCDVWCLCYYILYIIIIILYYTLLLIYPSFPIPLPSPISLPNILSHPFSSFPLSFILYLSVLTYTYLYSSFFLSSFLLFPSSVLLSSSQYSFYTCRYLHILIYILSIHIFPLVFPSLSRSHS